MMNFTIFRIPVMVDPFFWLTTFVLGGGFSAISAADKQVAFLGVAVWMVVAFISILVHELGHALTSRHIGGATVWIRLTSFCGLAFSQGGKMTRNQRAFMAFMGPAAGFGLLAVSFIASVILLGPGISWDIFLLSNLAPFEPLLSPLGLSIPYADFETLQSFVYSPENVLKFEIFYSFFVFNFFWGLVNLLPVLPLDGGHILNEYMKSPKKMHLISALTAVVICILGVSLMGNMLMAIFFGLFAYQNFTAFQNSKY